MDLVVLGAGFAGLGVARELQDDANVTLVAPGGRFVFVPLMHEVLGETVAPPEVTRDLAEVVPRARIVDDRAVRVEGREVVLASGERVRFDTLVVAVGAEPNDFGVPGVSEFALTFQTLSDAMRANAAVKDAVSRGLSRVVVVGASFTGVEVAGEVWELGRKLGARLSIVLLDALPEIFPRQSEKFRERVKAELAERGIELRTRAKIVEIGPGEVIVEGDKPVPSDVTFWCAGIEPRRIEGVDTNVRPTLQSASRDDVYVLGDAAVFPREADVPKLAQTAEDQARVCAWNILYPDAMRTYEPHVKGLVVSIGHHHAVAELPGSIVLAGNIPWHVKRMLYKAKIALA